MYPGLQSGTSPLRQEAIKKAPFSGGPIAKKTKHYDLHNTSLLRGVPPLSKAARNGSQLNHVSANIELFEEVARVELAS